MEGDERKWEEMETDCLVNIFQRLSLEDLTLGVPLVCKSWHKSSFDPFCWRVLDFQTVNLTPGRKFAERFQEKCAISSFSFAGFLKLVVGRSCKQAVALKFPYDHASIDDLALALNECPRLKILALPNLSPDDELQIPRLVGRLKQLERLEIDLKPSCFRELMEQIGINCLKFRELTMCGSIQREDARAIVNFAPKIKSLDLSRSYLLKGELLLMMNGCKEIERLSVNGCVGFEADEEVLEMASRIGKFEHVGSKLWDCYVHSSCGWDQLQVIN